MAKAQTLRAAQPDATKTQADQAALSPQYRQTSSSAGGRSSVAAGDPSLALPASVRPHWVPPSPPWWPAELAQIQHAIDGIKASIYAARLRCRLRGHAATPEEADHERVARNQMLSLTVRRTEAMNRHPELQQLAASLLEHDHGGLDLRKSVVDREVREMYAGERARAKSSNPHLAAVNAATVS